MSALCDKCAHFKGWVYHYPRPGYGLAVGCGRGCVCNGKIDWYVPQIICPNFKEK